MPDGMGLRGTVFTPTLRIEYLAHRKDLVGLRCISRDTLASMQYDRYTDDPRGAVIHVTGNADPRRRGMLKLTYFAQTRVLAGMLPGVRSYCADWLEMLTGRPRLRLVIDNTRGEPCSWREPPAA
jgi:hypothetical protein